MVVRCAKCATRRIFPSQVTQKGNLYRCLKCRLGYSLSSKLYGGSLVSFRKASTHQPTRIEGSFSGSTILQKASDNTSVVAYINKQSGTRSAELCALMWRILTCCNRNSVTLRARHIPGSLNIIADSLCRRTRSNQQWSFSPQIFKQISKLWEGPQAD